MSAVVLSTYGARRVCWPFGNTCSEYRTYSWYQFGHVFVAVDEGGAVLLQVLLRVPLLWGQRIAILEA
jgi:hypothetical protein